MNRYLPTTLWGIAAYRMTSAASFGLACYAASYTAMANRLMSGKRTMEGEGDKPMPPRAVSAPTTVERSERTSRQPIARGDAGVQKTAAPEPTDKPQVKAPAEPKPSILADLKIDSPSKSAGAQREAAKQIAPHTVAKRKGGKKRKGRPEGKDAH
jgi:hypothetical protein